MIRESRRAVTRIPYPFWRSHNFYLHVPCIYIYMYMYLFIKVQRYNVFAENFGKQLLIRYFLKNSLKVRIFFPVRFCNRINLMFFSTNIYFKVLYFLSLYWLSILLLFLFRGGGGEGFDLVKTLASGIPMIITRLTAWSMSHDETNIGERNRELFMQENSSPLLCCVCQVYMVV